MLFETTGIAGLWTVRLHRHEDARGSFARLFDRDIFAAHGVPPFVQQSLSATRLRGTLRGLHFQHPPHAEVKFVRCVRGAIFDVIADLRPDSPTHLRWQGFFLSPDSDLALCIPEGCAHGFLTLTDECDILYQMSAAFAPDHADGVRYDDPALGIVWPQPVGLVAEKDLAWAPIRR